MDEAGMDVSEVSEACRTRLDHPGYVLLGAGTRRGA